MTDRLMPATPGQIVYYRPTRDTGDRATFTPDWSGVVAALVLGRTFQSKTDHGINLRVFPNNAVTAGVFVHDVCQGDEPGQWSWPVRS